MQAEVKHLNTAELEANLDNFRSSPKNEAVFFQRIINICNKQAQFVSAFVTSCTFIPFLI